MSNLIKRLSIDAFYQVSIHLHKRFQRRRFLRNRPIRNKNFLWRPCLLTNRDEIKRLHRGPYIHASYQVSVHLPLQFQRRIFLRNRPIRNKSCLCRPCLLTDREEINNLYRGTYIHASYRVSVHLSKRFQRRRLKCEKFTDGRRRTDDGSSEGNSSCCLWQSELIKWTINNKCKQK